jgi:dolichol-phosphate mannosyltransferase
MNILVAVPVFNEEKYVRPVLREIRKYARASAAAENLERIRVLVVDDGSTDGTPAVLRELSDGGHIDLLTHPENRGYGQSLIDAFAYAAENGYDWVITMDCDEQHEPCRIPCFVKQCLKDDADIISGSRYRALSKDACLSDDDATSEGVPPPDRRNINRLITELLNSALHLNVLEDEHRRDADATAPGITDAFCGFKAHRVSAMQRMNLTIPGYAFPMQFWVQADALNLRIREIAVKLIYKDATRHFGGQLDDPAIRLQHYLEVFTAELREVRESGIHVRRELAEILYD